MAHHRPATSGTGTQTSTRYCTLYISSPPCGQVVTLTAHPHPATSGTGTQTSIRWTYCTHCPRRVSSSCLTPHCKEHNTEKSKQIFQEKELRGHQSQCPHSCVSVSDLHIPTMDLPHSAAGRPVGRSWEYMNHSQTHECGNWDWGRTISRKGLYKWVFRCSAIWITEQARKR